MARTLSRTDGSDVLREHPELDSTTGIINLEFPLPRKSIYSVSSGKEKISALLAWAFGLGHVGNRICTNEMVRGMKRDPHISDLNDLEFTPTRALDSPRDVRKPWPAAWR